MFTLKNCFQKGIVLGAILLWIPQVHAAEYRLGDANLITACNTTVDIIVDTEDADVISGDMTLIYDPLEVKVTGIDVGSALPMLVYENIDANTVQLSVSRFPKSGFFDGQGVFGRLTLQPTSDADEVTISFSPDLKNDNNLIDEGINNVLTDVFSKTYTVQTGYNGFCSPDNAAPTVDFVSPAPNAGGISPDTNIVVAATDNRSGVNQNSVEILINGKVYSAQSKEVSIVDEGGLMRIKLNPAGSFARGDVVEYEVEVCDFNTPANCATYSNQFHIAPSSNSSNAVCGDGKVDYQDGEQCDDGNNKSGDGCSLSCLKESNVTKATCSDGIHNQGESGIDCGGPCAKSCQTCSTSYSGSSGGSQILTDSDLVTVCHYPVKGDKQKAYSLRIPKAVLSVYRLRGDTLGPCASFDQCPQALLAAAPEREKEALEEAGKAIEKGVIEKSKTAIDAPERGEGGVSQRERCLTNPDFVNADLDRGDLDGDGLSDFVECLGGTHPEKKDTDDDGCDDFSELNQYYSDPLDPNDCEVLLEADQFSEVLITDPKPSWVLSTLQPTISGKAPNNAQFVLGVATSADQLYINQLVKVLQQILALDESSAESKTKTLLDELNRYTNEAKEFVKNYSDSFDSVELAETLDSIPITLTINDFFSESTRGELEKIRFDLLKLRIDPITAVATTEFLETFVGELPAKNFEAISNELKDNRLYDLVVTVYLNNGLKVSSKPIRFSVNTANTISKPVPRTIGSRSINDTSGFTSFMIGGKALAQNENGQFEIEINDDRPTITGETEFGSNVFAVWHSVVLASSVISDSERGAFDIQAPKPLEIDTPHRATLYAVKSDDEGNQLRSESVDVYFRIKKKNTFANVVLVLTGIILLGGAAYILRERIYKRNLNVRIK